MPIEGPAPMVVTTESITLRWDAPLGVLSGPLAIASYRLFYRRHGDPRWYEVQEIPAAQGTFCVLRHASFGDGAFDFAVESVDGAGDASVLHTSADSNAVPEGGWYVLWQYAGS